MGMEGLPKEIQRKDWSLIYNPEFDAYREKYKNIVSTVKKVIEGEEVEGVTIENLGSKTSRERFILGLGDDKFFIKRTEEGTQGGVGEFKSGHEVEDILKRRGVEGVEIADCLFAFTQGDTRYTVYKYDERLQKSFRSYIDKLYMENKDSEELKNLTDRVVEIKGLLTDYHDVTTLNMGYDKEKDTIILFDLNRKSDLLIPASDEEL